MTIKKACNFISLVGMAFVAAACIYLWKKGIFASQEKLQSFVSGFGLIGGMVFVFIQIVQVVIPIIPGGISCLAGVVLFVWRGNGKLCGDMRWLNPGISDRQSLWKTVIEKMFQPKLLEKYESWTETKTVLP